MGKLPPDWANLIAGDDARFGDDIGRVPRRRYNKPRHRLSPEELAYIRSSAESATKLAEDFGVHRGTIWNIRTGRYITEE